MAGVNLTNAYVTLIPSFEGAQSKITEMLVPASEKAGDDAGKKASTRFGGSFKKGMAVAGGLAVAGTVAAFKGLYEVGTIFDDVGDTIRVGTGATGKDLEGLIGVAKNIGKTVPVEFDKIGTTVADLNTRMGLSGDTLDKVATQYLNAGRILGEDVDVTKTSAAFNAFKIEGDGVSAAMDHLFQVSQATGVGMNELASSVAAQAPALQTLGFSYEEAVAMVGSFDKAGLNSSAIMASMSKGMVTLAKDGEEPQAAFKRVVSEIEGFTKAGDKAAALELAAKVFGTKGAAQFVGALESGALNMDDLGRAAGQTSDTINGVAGETDDFAEKWQLVKNNALLALEPLGSTVFDSLGSALEKVLPHIESFGVWLGENQWVISAFAGLIGVTLVGAFASWTASIWANTIALLANPVTWIVLGITALIAAIVLLWQNWDSVTAWISDVWGSFMDWITSGLDSFSTWWSDTWSKVSSWFSDKWNSIKSAGETAWQAVSDFFKSVGQGIADWFMNWTLPGLLLKHWDSIKAAAESAWNKILDFFRGIPGKISGFFKTVGEKLSKPFKAGQEAVQKGWDGLMDFIRGIPGKVGSALSGIADKISGPFKRAFNGIASAWNSTVGKISFTAPDWVPGMGGKGFSVPKIPMLATGGTATAAGWSLVGEMGPELLHLPRGASVVPLGHPASAGAFGDSNSGGMSRADMDYLARMIAEFLRPFAEAAGMAAELTRNAGRFAGM